MAYKNHEGYSDPTAGEAIKSEGHMPEQIYRDYCILRAMAYRMGLEITEIRDRKNQEEMETGRLTSWTREFWKST